MRINVVPVRWTKDARRNALLCKDGQKIGYWWLFFWYFWYLVFLVIFVLFCFVLFLLIFVLLLLPLVVIAGIV